jgi:hypothetical protein
MMRKVKIGSIILILFLSVSVLGCNNTIETLSDEQLSQRIVKLSGWNCDAHEISDTSDGQNGYYSDIIFNDDGTFSGHYRVTGQVSEPIAGTYSIKDGKIYMEAKKEERNEGNGVKLIVSEFDRSDVFDVNFSGTRMILEHGDNHMYYYCSE